MIPQLVANEKDRTGMPGRTLKYVKIRNWLVEQIANGEFSVGEQLPSEHEIMDRFKVSRVTARQAFDELRRGGLVEAKRGKGYFVSRFRATASLERLQGFGEMLAPLGVETRSNVLELIDVAAENDVSEALKLSDGEVVTRLSRVRLAGGTAVSIDVSFYPLDIGHNLMVLDLAREDVFVLMEQRLGLELGYADVSLDVAPVLPEHTKFLGVEENQSVLRLRRLTFDNSGRAIAFERIYSRLETMTFQARITRW